MAAGNLKRVARTRGKTDLGKLSVFQGEHLDSWPAGGFERGIYLALSDLHSVAAGKRRLSRRDYLAEFLHDKQPFSGR